MEHKKVIHWLSGMVAVVFFSSHVVWAHSAESNFWSERAEMSRRLRGGVVTPGPGFFSPLPTVEHAAPTKGFSPLGTEWASLLGQHGTVRDVRLRPGSPVIFVQDVHGHRAAQENIAEIVLSFLSRYPQAPVVLEGAAGPVSLEKGRGKSVAANRGAAAFFFNAGILSGAEYAVLAAPVTPSVFGGEDASLYRKNRLALDQAHLLSGSFEKIYIGWQRRLGTAKESVFSKELKELDRLSLRWASGAGFIERATFLAETGKLPPPALGSALALFLKVASLEKSFSLKQVSLQRAAFMDSLSPFLTPAETDDLSRAALSLRAGEQSIGFFYEKLNLIAQRKGVALQKFPDFNTYVRYVLLADQIRPEALQKELEEREESLWTVLAKTAAQRDLHRLARDMALVRGLLNLILTPAEWADYQERRKEIHQIPLRLAEAAEPMDLVPFEQFYETAQLRNQALVEHTLTALVRAPAGTPVLLVAGGFHSAGVARLLSDRNVGLVTLAPRFSDVADAPGAFGLFYRDRTPLELLFDSPRITLSETLTLSPLTDEGMSRALAFMELSEPLRGVLAGGLGDGAQRIVSGSTIIDVRDRGFPAKSAEGTTPVLMDVPAGIGKKAASAPLVSVYRTKGSPLRRLWNALKKRTTKILGVALLGAVLLPFSGLPEAQAYSLTSGPHGVQNPSNPQISSTVRAIAERNSLKNPNLIQPGVPYRVDDPPRPSAQVQPSFEPPAESPSPSTEPKETRMQPKSPAGGISNPLSILLSSGAVTLAVGIVSHFWPNIWVLFRNVKTAARRILGRITPKIRRALLPGALLLGVFTVLGGLSSETIGQLALFIENQWRVEFALILGLTGAVYFIWIRSKEINLSLVEQNEPRLKEWVILLDRMKESKEISEEDLSRLVNNLHALVLNNRITAKAVSDRAVLERRIDIYRALSSLSQKTVQFLDQRLVRNHLSELDGARLLDVREKFFLYQLYGLKVSNALVPASVAHWALSNYEREDSWFERRRVGALLRMVRGVPSMIRGSVQEYTGRLLHDMNKQGKTLWDQAEGLSVAGLGNILTPGLYSETDKKELAEVFTVLAEKVKTKELPDMSAKDLHRKGWGTFTSLLIWGVAVSQMMSVLSAFLAFFTGVGVTMALFRLQALGVRRDGFFREAIAQWRDMNRRPHLNGKMNGNGVGEDPFHLNRDFARHNFDAAEEALASELIGDVPSADVVLLIAQNESERIYFEQKAKDKSLFRADVPVVVLTVPEGKGSFYAYARAWTYLFSEEFQEQRAAHPHLRDRSPSTMGVVTLVSKTGSADGMGTPLKGLPSVQSRIGSEKLGDRTIFDLALMNAYRATRGGQQREQGGMALRWADRAYVGPVRVPQGPGICLETQWANRAEMARYNFGAVIASLDKPIELIRRHKNGKTLKYLVKEHPTRVYDLFNDWLKQVQAFSGEGVYAFDEEGAKEHAVFLADVLKRADDLNGTAPSLNLMTYFLVPMAIAQANSDEVARKISVAFAAQGFFANPLPQPVQDFNITSANALAEVIEKGSPSPLSLNAGFVDETIYAGAAGFDEEDDFSPILPVPPTGKKGGSARFLIYPFQRFAATGILSLGVFLSSVMPAFSAPVNPPTTIPAVMTLPSSLKGGGRSENIGLILSDLRAQGLSNPSVEGELRSFIREIPLEGHLTDHFNLERTKTLVQKSSVAEGIVDGVARTALASQIAVAWETHQRGHRPEAELRQTAFLSGLAGRPRPDDVREDFLWGPLARLFGAVDGGPASVSWTQGEAARKEVLETGGTVSAGPAKNLTTVLRVTELLREGDEDRRAAMVEKLEQRVQAWDSSQQPDILLINGVDVADLQWARRAIRRSAPVSPRMEAYLSACRWVAIGRDQLTIDQVRAGLAPAERWGRSMDLYTADPSALILDPRQGDLSCRVLLLEWAQGELHTLDLLGLARAALERARVVSTNA